MAFDFSTLKFDRTGGSYGVADLLRVQDACWALKWQMDDMGYQVELHPTIGWDTAKVPKASTMAAHLDNVVRIRDTLGLALPLPPTMGKLTITGANQIEQCLAVAHDTLAAIHAGYRYAGPRIYAGGITL